MAEISDSTVDIPRCPQCGRLLDDVPHASDGPTICPQCAHSVAPPVDDQATEIYLPSELLRNAGEERFRLAGRLGEGGFGTVYRAFDRSLRRNVAIKVPKKSAGGFDADQFIREARAASALRHPNVVTVFDVGFDGDAPYIVSECIEGVSLRQWLDGPQATFDGVAAVAEKLCRAIGYAHAMGVVHRDIKPSNVIVDDAGEPHILDFGLSNSRVTGEAVRFRRSVAVGTPAYMAPEQANGDLERIGAPADVYALGVVLYQMLTRRLPFVGSSERILDLVLNEEPVRPRAIDSRVPAALEAVALKAMRKEIEDRYSSADAMAEDLGRYRRGEPVKALGRHDKRSLVMTARRRFLGGVAATATCGCVGAAAWLLYRQRRDDPRVRVRLDGNSSDETATWIPLDPTDLSPRKDAIQVAAGSDEVYVEPGFFRVLLESEAGRADVYRTVSPHGQPAVGGRVKFSESGLEVDLRWLTSAGKSVTVVPHIETIPLRKATEGLAYYPAGSIEYRHPRGQKAFEAPKPIDPFYLDARVATVADVALAFRAPIFNAGRPATADARLPFPVAVEFAERRGLSLMTAWEWLYAATNRGTTRFPWGDDLPADWTWADLAAVDRTAGPSPVTGLFSGDGEWSVTANPPAVSPKVLAASRLPPPPRRRAVVGSAVDSFSPKPPAPILPERVFELVFKDESLSDFPVGVRCVRRTRFSA